MANAGWFLVVGASSSIGRAVLARAAQDGYACVGTYTARTDDQHVVEKGVGREYLDLTDDASITSFVQRCRDRAIRFSSVALLSGFLPGKSLQQYSAQEMREVMQVNFTGNAHLLAELLPELEEGCSVVMMSSISARRGSYDPVYAAAKGAVISFVKSLATQLAPHIRINAVAPGLVERTGMWERMEPDRREWHREHTPDKRLARPEDVAGIIVDLTQPRWAHVNGVCLDINGGEYV